MPIGRLSHPYRVKQERNTLSGGRLPRVAAGAGEERLPGLAPGLTCRVHSAPTTTTEETTYYRQRPDPCSPFHARISCPAMQDVQTVTIPDPAGANRPPISARPLVRLGLLIVVVAAAHGFSVTSGLWLDDHLHFQQLQKAGWNFRDLVDASTLDAGV